MTRTTFLRRIKRSPQRSAELFVVDLVRRGVVERVPNRSGGLWWRTPIERPVLPLDRSDGIQTRPRRPSQPPAPTCGEVPE